MEDGIQLEDGPQPPEELVATVQLRWMLSPTPGERPELQQLFVGASGREEWRRVPFVDWRERSVV
jgi:hypothetical protein